MAVDSATTAGPQPQARSTAEDGRARLSCFARNARIRGPRGLGARGGRAGEESRRPAVAGSRPASGSECIAAPDPPAQGRRDAAVPSRQGEPRLKRPSPAMTGSTAPPTQARTAKKLAPRFTIEWARLDMPGHQRNRAPHRSTTRPSRPRSLPISSRSTAATRSSGRADPILAQGRGATRRGGLPPELCGVHARHAAQKPSP